MRKICAMCFRIQPRKH